MAHILVIEDQPAGRSLLTTLLGYHGHTVLEARDGAEGLALTRAERPDLVIADVLMPGMDGYEFARRVRADPALAHTRVVFYTATYLVDEVRRIAEASGVSHVLTKPAEPEKILEVVNAALRAEPSATIPMPTAEMDREYLRLLTATLHRKVEELKAEIQAREQAEVALRESERKFNIIYDKAPFAGALSRLPNGVIVEVNEAFERVFGYSKQEVTGKTSLELGINPDSEGRARVTAELQARGSVHDMELMLQTKSGIARVFLVNLDLVDIGGQKYVLQTAQDITERKQAEEKLRKSEERYRGTLENMLEGCQIIGFDWRYIYVNDEAARHGREVKRNLLGRTMLEVYPGIEHTELFTVLQRCMEERISQQMENEFVYPAGNTARFELRIQPVPEGIFILSIDITERKRAEEEIHRLNRELEQRVVERTAQLEAANQELRKANRAKDLFLAGVSHELRTPLNAIIGFTGTLLMKLPGPLTGDQEKQLQTIQASARHLLALINDLLDLAKIESGKTDLHLEPVVCQEVITEVAASLRPLAETKGLALEVVLPDRAAVVLADRRALSQIIINLTNNAIKFTETGRVCVQLDQRHDTKRGRQLTEVSVIDTGAGIRPEDQVKLFEAFMQLEGTTVRRYEGSGLGLHLSQKLAALLGGRITFSSEYGSGSTFTLVLEEK